MVGSSSGSISKPSRSLKMWGWSCWNFELKIMFTNAGKNNRCKSGWMLITAITTRGNFSRSHITVPATTYYRSIFTMSGKQKASAFAQAEDFLEFVNASPTREWKAFMDLTFLKLIAHSFPCRSFVNSETQSGRIWGDSRERFMVVNPDTWRQILPY